MDSFKKQLDEFIKMIDDSLIDENKILVLSRKYKKHAKKLKYKYKGFKLVIYETR